MKVNQLQKLLMILKYKELSKKIEPFVSRKNESEKRTRHSQNFAR